MNSGIYTITNLVNGKMYVGYATDFKERKGKHFTTLKGNYHSNPHLQSAYNEYGKENLVFEILEEYPNNLKILASMEHYWCNLLNVHNREIGYNIRPTHPDNFM